MTEEEKQAILASMYDQGEEDPDAPRPQPEQLRLAGKATLMPHQGGNVALARIEYVETLEATVRAQQKQIDDLNSRLRKLELRIERTMNIAGKRIQTVESQVKTIQGNRWEY
jgi:hypothetical protein